MEQNDKIFQKIAENKEEFYISRFGELEEPDCVGKITEEQKIQSDYYLSKIDLHNQNSVIPPIIPKELKAVESIAKIKENAKKWNPLYFSSHAHNSENSSDSRQIKEKNTNSPFSHIKLSLSKTFSN